MKLQLADCNSCKFKFETVMYRFVSTFYSLHISFVSSNEIKILIFRYNGLKDI